jgi:hypothetical protein
MTYESIPNLLGAYKVVLEERAEGVYVNVIESPFATEPYIDILQPNLELAKLAGRENYGILDHQWMVVPDVDWHAPG